MRPPREDTQPWYRQFWPWFLIALPGSVVIASMVTITLAVKTNDGLVKDDYYKQGLAIHRDAAKVEQARQLGVNARVELTDGRIIVQLNEAAVGQLDSLNLLLYHPTVADKDQRLRLARSGDRRYEAALATLAPANWRLQVEPESSLWRIRGRMPLPEQNTAYLE